MSPALTTARSAWLGDAGATAIAFAVAAAVMARRHATAEFPGRTPWPL